MVDVYREEVMNGGCVWRRHDEWWMFVEKM